MEVAEVYDLTTGERIRLLRKRAGMTLRQLAAASGLSEASLSRYERDEVDPSGDAIRALAVALNSSADYLLRLRATASKRGRKAHPRRSKAIQSPLVSAVN